MNLIKGLPREPKPNELVGLDIELYGMDENKLHRPTGTFACLSIAYQNGDVYQVYDLADLRESLKIVNKGKWVFHNALFDINHLRRFTTFRQRPVWDTMLVEQNLFGGYYDTFSLRDLSRRWLGTPMEKDTVKLFITETEMDDEMQTYAAMDSLNTVLCAAKQGEYADEHDLELESYWLIDEPALWAVLDLPPVKVDVKGWLALAAENEALAQKAEEGLGFNPRSPKQAKEALNKVLKTSIKDTREATLHDLLEKASGKGNKKATALLEGLIEARIYNKAAGTYGASWIEQHVEEGDLVYPNYLITQAETGRMACRSPNLQNIPQRRMPQFRNLFISSYSRGVMLVVDVIQQEPRVLAYSSKDQELIKALMNREDLHLSVARTVFGDDTITKEDPRRFIGKTINLGTSYGLSAYGLAKRLDISEDKAQQFLNKYFARFRGVADWTYRQHNMAQRMGYVVTPIGRRIWINPYNRQWQNNSINAPIQGGAADMTKYALAFLHKETKLRGLPYGVCLLVHDEMVCDLPPGNTREYKAIQKEAWTEAGKQIIPGIPVEIEAYTGRSWGAKH